MKIKGLQKFLRIFVLGFLTSLTPFSIDLNLPAFPAIAHDLHTPLAKVSLTISFYFVAYALGQIIYGPFLDRFGRKIPIYFGLSLYILANLGCLLSQSLEMLLIFRILSALGGSGATVGANTMVRDYFPQKEVARVFSFLILVISLSPFLAPSIGSLIVTHWSWRAVFAVLSGVAGLDILLVAFALPTVYKPDISVGLSLKPIFQTFRKILNNRHFTVYSLSGALCFSGLFVFVASSPSIFFDEFKITTQMFGAVFAAIVGGLIIGSQLNHLFVSHFGSAKTFKTTLSLQALISLVFLIGAIFHLYNVLVTGIFFFFLMSFAGIASPNAAALAIEPFSINIGAAASLLGFIQEGIGGSIAATSGLLSTKGSLLTAAIICITSISGLVILLLGKSPLKS